MPFDARDIRTGMDVYAWDGRYLGVVAGIDQVDSAPNPTGASIIAVDTFTGESLGPAPTVGLGSSGPLVQRRGTEFHSRPDGAPLLKSIRVRRPGSFQARSIPILNVQIVSMERVVLTPDAIV